MPTIAFTNQKGGVGKTTSAISVAAELAAAGNSTLLVDLDPQGNASSGLGLSKDGPGSYELLMRDGVLKDLVQSTSVPGLDAVTGGEHLAGAEVELADAEGRYVRLARALSEHPYRYVIVDCPPALGFLSLNALVGARFVMIPVQCEYYALEGLSSLFEILRKVKKSLNPELELLGVFITMYDKRLRLAAQVRSEVAKHFPNQSFETVVPRTVRLAEAPSYGEPIGRFDVKSTGAKAYQQLAKEVHERIEARSWQRA